MKRIAAAASLVVVSTLAVLGATPAAAQPTRQTVPPDVDVAITLANVADYVRAVEQANVAVYVHAVQMADVETYVEAVAASTPPPSPARATTPSVSSAGGGGVGACTGFSIPDYIIQRESGGSPTAVNPSSGAIGCSQTLPEHYSAGGACAGLDMHSVDGQRACTNILSDGGTNLAPWALTR